jgi:hypothetical protein
MWAVLHNSVMETHFSIIESNMHFGTFQSFRTHGPKLNPELLKANRRI